MDLFENLFARRRFNILPGLERTIALAEFCGNPQNSFRSIHVAGTNGKGTTATMLASILVEAGYKTGLYTSPHIYKFNERIKINDKQIPTADLKRIAEELLTVADDFGATFFEITTILAFKYFAEQNVDFVVIECGMGGENDSTNIINPILSVITHIAMDHSEYLGDTLELIATEKAGIIKQNTPVVIAESNQDLYNIFQNTAENKSAEIFFADKTKEINSSEITPNLTTKIVSSNYGEINFPLAGAHQLDNMATVLTASNYLCREGIIKPENVNSGIEKMKETFGLHFRTELIHQNPPIVFDAAHNPDSIRALVALLNDTEYKKLKWNLIFAAMEDKDVKEMLELLAPLTNKLYLPKLITERAEHPNHIAKIARELGYKNTHFDDSPLTAYQNAILLKEPVLVAGSFYLLSEIRI
jgi:dihydrofolate synthase / folylpolyglutamate synthase